MFHHNSKPRSCTASTETLFVNPRKAKILPASSFDQAKIGKRVSLHPLHETYIGPGQKERRDDFYGKAEPGMLVVELDSAETDDDEVGSRRHGSVLVVEEPERLQRIQRVYTTPLDQLQEIWAKVAQDARRPNGADE